MRVVMDNQQTKLVVEVVVPVVLVIQTLLVELVFNFQPHLEIQVDFNMITTQIIHLDLVQLLVIL